MTGDSPTKPAGPTADEQKILADIFANTGLSFRRAGGIPTNDPAIAVKVLPILVRWFDLMPDPGHRSCIADLFKHPTAHPYLDTVLRWWHDEPDELARGGMTQVVAELMEAGDAEKVWLEYRRVPADPFLVFILRKLARYKPTSQAARDEAVRLLREGPPFYGPLEIFSRINDPRIRRWFRDRVHDPDPQIRRLAVRVANRGKPLPLQVQRSAEGPDRFSELFSAEGDLRDLEEFLRKAEHRLSVKIPAWLRKAEFRDRMERDEWVWAEIASKVGEGVNVWLRLEDLDVIEIVITPSGSEEAKPQKPS